MSTPSLKKNIDEVTVFTNGDSSQLSTWSNVPYFFVESLLRKGIKVNRVDISPPKFIEFIHYKLLWRLIKLINPNTAYDCFHSILHAWIVKQRIMRALHKYPNSDANIFLTFSFSTYMHNEVPSIQICDWTFDYYLQYFENRRPDIAERYTIKYENKMIDQASIVISLFSTVADHMNESLKKNKVHYLGNVINALITPSKDACLKLKSESQTILFIGNKKYISGAISLIKVFKELRTVYSSLALHIIGIKQQDFEEIPDGVICHGYLDKGVQSQSELYYNLLMKAKVFVNTTRKWSAFSATIEAMYFYTPVIISNYEEVTRNFGTSPTFGFYCEEWEMTLQKKCIEKILLSDNYTTMCIESHEAVKLSTWSVYTDRVLSLIKSFNQ